jgi:energy-coupling factor transporter ATP-binding protein EcfA2
VRLCELAVENFRAFRQASVRLPPQGLVLVAGANNSGKSSLLSGLDVVAGSPGEAASLRHAGTDGTIRVTATFHLGDDRAALLATLPGDNATLVPPEAMTRMQYVFEEREGQGPALVEIRGYWPSLGMPPLAQIQWDTGNRVFQLYTSALANEVQAGAGAEPPSDPLRLVHRATLGSPGSAPVFLSTLVLQPQLGSIGQFLDQWRTRFYHFRALRQGTQRTQSLASADRLDPQGSGLSAVLLYLLTDRPTVFEHVRGLMAEIVPDLGRLQVRTGGGQLQIVFESATGDRNLKDLGTGVEQLLMTLTVGLMEAPPFTLVVEEPETNLHPAAQRALLGLLQSWAIDRQVIAATHSTVMLDWSPGGDRLWLVTRDQGTSQVEPVNQDPLPLLRSLGVRLSDVLSADRVLVVEGPSDEDMLAAWFPELLRSPRVAVLYGEGGDSAVHVDQLASWLAGTDRADLRRVLYLRDRDELSPAVLDRLTASPTVYVLERRELENYLLEPDALALVLAPLAPKGKPIAAEDVAAVIAQAADRLRRRIIVNRVARQIRPTRLLIDHRLRQELASADADADTIAAAVLERLMTAQDVREQIDRSWAEAQEDVAQLEGTALLAAAPGAEILDAVFMHFAGRHYRKRDDGVAIAQATSAPAEIQRVLEAFLADTAEDR